MNQERLRRLAANIEALEEKDAQLVRETRAVEEARRRGALELHTSCLQWVNEVNSLLVNGKLRFDPSEYSLSSFHGHDVNLFQLNARGRILQIEFEAPETLVSTEHFRVPYILEGAVRSFNQEFLDREAIEEQHLFYCRERGAYAWRFFDARSYRTGLFDHEYLISLFEQLL